MKHLESLIWPQDFLAVSCHVKVFISMFDINLKTLFQELWLFVPTTSKLALADSGLTCHFKYSVEASTTVLYLSERLFLREALKFVSSNSQQLRTVKTDTLEELSNKHK